MSDAQLWARMPIVHCKPACKLSKASTSKLIVVAMMRFPASMLDESCAAQQTVTHFTSNAVSSETRYGQLQLTVAYNCAQYL